MSYVHCTDEEIAGEEWMPVVRYARTYQVSSLGRVRRVGRSSGARVGRLVSMTAHSAGYLSANLWQDNIGCQWLVHRLVVEAFIGPFPPGYQVNHIDGDKHNNRLSNLEMVTCQENVDHALATGLADYKGEANAQAVLTEGQVAEIRSRYVPGGHRCGGPGYKALAKEYGVNWSAIRNIVKRRRWQHV